MGPRRRSRAACEARGKGRVYLDFLLELLRGLHAEGRTVQFWGDIVEQHPELIDALPRERTVALAWGYDAPRDPADVAAPVRELLASVGITDLDRLRGQGAEVVYVVTGGGPRSITTRACPPSADRVGATIRPPVAS